MKLKKTSIVAITAALLVVSCSEEKEVVVHVGESALIIGDPLDCGLDSLTLFPVGCSYNPEIVGEGNNVSSGALEAENGNQVYATTNRSSSIKFNKNVAVEYQWDQGATVEYINEDQSDFDIRNLLFYNMLSGESYPLVHDSIHILSFALHKEFELPLIFYRVVKDDYNKDKKFNGHDPVMLYVSNLDGTKFTQVTPETEHFVEYKLYAQTNTILIKTAIDSDKNLKFLMNDETNFRSMNLGRPAFAKNIFDQSIKDTLRKYN